MADIFVVSPTSAVRTMFQEVAMRHRISYGQCDDVHHFLPPAEPSLIMAWECYPLEYDAYRQLIPHTRRLLWVYDTERYPDDGIMGIRAPMMKVLRMEMQYIWLDPIDYAHRISYILVKHLGVPEPPPA